MDRKTELSLIDELLALKSSGAAFLDDHVAEYPIKHYTDDDRFQAEQRCIFRALPSTAVHVSELPKNGSFLTRIIGGQPVLITKGKDGQVRAFLNACRHRGSQLVSEASGCKNRFSCPYHAWTYSSEGALIGAPHFEEGFPGVDKADLSLIPLHCRERFGFVWIWNSDEGAVNFDHYFDELEEDLKALRLSDMKIAGASSLNLAANWKILVEGGIEAYHFRVAHRKTIGPHFEDNLSSYRSFGPHMRSVLPRTSMQSLTDEARDSWRLRDHANIIYTLFPTSQLLVMQDHVVWISLEPKSASETMARLVTLAPTTGPDADGKNDAHWKRNHQITMTTLDEDFVIGAAIQENAMRSATPRMLFGKFEGALDQFNRTIKRYLE